MGVRGGVEVEAKEKSDLMLSLSIILTNFLKTQTCLKNVIISILFFQESNKKKRMLANIIFLCQCFV